MKTKFGRADRHVGKEQSFLMGRGSFLGASNSSSFSAGTEGQLNGLSVHTCIEQAVEKTKYLLSRDVADINQVV